MNALLERLGRFAARHRWWVVGFWLVLLVGSIGADRVVGGEYVNDYTVPGSSTSRGLDVLDDDFRSASGFQGQIVFHSGKGKLAQQSDALATTMKNVGGLPDVVKATDPLTVQGTPAVSKDGTIAYGTVAWSVNPASLDQGYLDQLDTAVKPARSAGVTVDYGGGAGQIGQQPDDTVSEVIGLAAALLLLLVMFASIVAALVPLVGAIFSVGTGLALVGLVAAAINLPTTAPAVATLLGLGVAIDYGLFLVARHREQLDHGMDLDTSVGKATGSSGSAVVVAGSTVVVAILGLYVSGVPFVGALGLAAAIVVAVTMVSALTLVPAFLAISRRRVLARSDRSAQQDAASSDDRHEHSAFAVWGRKVSDRPWPWAVGSTLALLVLAIPLLWLDLGQLDAGTDPTTQSDRRAYDLISEGFGEGANGPLTVVLELKKQSQQQTQQLLSKTEQTLGKQDDVASVAPAALNKAGTVAVINVVSSKAPDAQRTTDLVDHLTDSVLPGLDVRDAYLVGTTVGYVTFTEKIAGRMVPLILAVVMLSFLLLTVAFRSLVIPTKAAVLNLLSVGAAYGVVVAVFQWQWGSGLIGIDQSLPVPAYVPMLMFAIVFGLSMDYEVFLLSRVREAWHRTGDAHRAVAIGIGSTARVITTAAAIMIVVFVSFVRSDDPAIKMIAIGMAVAVLVDASIVRMILVPSLMSLLGPHAWWLPRWLDRVIPDLELEGPIEPAAPPPPAVTTAAGRP